MRVVHAWIIIDFLAKTYLWTTNSLNIKVKVKYSLQCITQKETISILLWVNGRILLWYPVNPFGWALDFSWHSILYYLKKKKIKGKKCCCQGIKQENVECYSCKRSLNKLSMHRIKWEMHESGWAWGEWGDTQPSRAVPGAAESRAGDAVPGAASQSGSFVFCWWLRV